MLQPREGMPFPYKRVQVKRQENDGVQDPELGDALGEPLVHEVDGGAWIRLGHSLDCLNTQYMRRYSLHRLLNDSQHCLIP